jgi:hypothetical protein
MLSPEGAPYECPGQRPGFAAASHVAKPRRGGIAWPVILFAALALGCFSKPVCAAETGSITGTVDKPARVTAVFALDRDNDKKFLGKLDAASGRFTIDGLPLGARYDCVLDLAGGRLEGVNLKVPHSDYEKEQPLTKEDVETITATAKSLNQFEDRVEILAVTGNIQHAAVVLNKLRTKPFINSNPGEMIWRLELWHFERPDDAWIKDQEELGIILYRERLQKKDFDRKSLTLDPALGGVHLTEKLRQVDVGRVELPGAEPGVRLRPLKAEGGRD